MVETERKLILLTHIYMTVNSPGTSIQHMGLNYFHGPMPPFFSVVSLDIFLLCIRNCILRTNCKDSEGRMRRNILGD